MAKGSDETHQRAVQDAVLAEDDQPGEGAHDDACQQREHRGDDQDALQVARRARDDIGGEEAKQERNRRRRQRNLQRPPQHRTAEAAGKEGNVRREGTGALAEGRTDGDRDRQHQEQGDQQRRRQREPPADVALQHGSGSIITKSPPRS
jgi:hypothetical protein